MTEATVLVREVVWPRWPFFRLGPPSLDGLTRRRGAGLIRLLHVGEEPVVVAVAGTGPVVFAARAASEAAARAGIARMRFATGVDDDVEDFHERFRDDAVLGYAIRARPWLRVRRNPYPWETLAWSVTEQLIDMERATAIQRRLIGAFGRRHAGLRDSPTAERIAASAPAELDACGLHPKRSVALRRVAREVAAGRVQWGDRARLLAIRDIGTWTMEMVALHGLGHLDVVPAGDLNYLKLIGRLTTGNPKAVADEAEVRGFFAPYAPYAGMAAQYLVLNRATMRPARRRAGTRWSAEAPRKVVA